ncbi:MAG: efflux transporter outer membrane subunit [Planctomycetes bacterium]|jgi:NodT family efflux transporter outer membrane factor (OMF) lipoprotein|nr:efflux transporter outer membrane subunit [Planctomycetota bacterium]
MIRVRPFVASLLGLLLTACTGTPVCRVDLTRPLPVLGWRAFFVDPDLAALVEVALAANLDARVALQRIEAARAQYEAAGGALLPTVGAVADGGIRRFGLYTMDGAGNLGVPLFRGREIPRNLPDFRVGLQASWEIDLWGRLGSARDAAFHRLLATEEMAALVRTELCARVADLYYDLLAKDAEARVLADTIALQQRSLEAVGLQRAFGAVNELTRQQFEVQLRSLEAEQGRVRIEIAALEAALNSLCGRGPQPVQRGAVPLERASLPALASGVAPEFLRNRPDVRGAELELAAAEADLEAARAAFWPRLSIDGLIGMQAFRADLLTDRRSTTYGLLGGLVAPIWNRAALDAEFAGANAAQLAALFTFQQVVTDATLELHNVLATLRLLDDVRTAQLQQTTTAERSIGVAGELFRAGRATFVEVLGVQQASLQARLGLVQVDRDRLRGAVALYRALGGGAAVEPNEDAAEAASGGG